MEKQPKQRIGYVRVSRETQDEQSQVKLLLDNEIKYDLIFIDAGISGTKPAAQRTGWKKMVEFVNTGVVGELVVSEYSRIGRDTKDMLAEIIGLERLGIQITTLAKNEQVINTIPSEFQPMMLTILSLGADIERKHASERTKWGMENAKREGRFPGRPHVMIDWLKIEETRKKYDCSLNMARKICGYRPSTFYKLLAEQHKQEKMELTPTNENLN